MSGDGDPVGGGAWAKDDGRGIFLPGATEVTVPVQGVWGGYGGGIFGGSQGDIAWDRGRGDTELEKLSHGGRAADVLDGLPSHGVLPGGGMPRTGGDKDSDAVPFSTPAFPGHRGHFVGGKPPPPKVPLMRHTGPLAHTEQKKP